MKTIGITLTLTTCLFAACLAPGYEEELGEASLVDQQKTPDPAPASKGLVLPAQNPEEWRLFMLSEDTSRVRSMDDWELCLRDTACNPLAGIDPAVADAFTRSLVFRNGGLAGADFAKVETLLTYAQFLNLWDTFGIGEELFVAWEGYECAGVGTCSARMNHICTDNC